MYYIIDNFLSDSHYKTILDYVLTSKYTFKNHTTHPENITKDTFDYQFIRIITYLTEENTYRGVPRDELNKIMPLWDKLQLNKILRCKINCNPNSDKNNELGWHRDVEDGSEGTWFSCILYFTTCDGHTLLKTNDKTVKVDSVANRALIFPSIWEHTGCSPTDVKARFIINTIFEIDPKEKKLWMN
jgi:hypothetical protein|tara:strand:+ start:1979 stop:2536 length:558 start_codon:yes stop_codon:yes gene_type:complete